MTKSPKVLPPQGFFITGTNTGIGKTVVTAYLLSLFNNRGFGVGVMKPIETGINDTFSDAEFLIQAGNLDDPLNDISPYRFKTPAAPEVAAKIENVRIEIPKIRKKFNRLSQKYETLLVEGIGGILVPILENYFVADLVEELDLPLIIVTRPDLGTINHTLLTLECAEKRDLNIFGIIINETRKIKLDNSQNKNLEILQHYFGSLLIGRLPYIPKLTFHTFDLNTLKKMENFLPFEAFII